jgi:putative metallohydrolase (TIGR04338 family)
MIPMADDTHQVYAAEADAADLFAPRRFTRFAQVVDFAESVVESEFWDENWPHAPTHLIVERRSRNATASLAGRQGDTAVVWLIDSLHWDVMSVLHELAHVATDSDHDHRFRAALLGLVRRFVGIEAFAALNAAYKRRGL